jgi:glycosyltransferase involved in cell wall biosynthesis
VRVLYVNHTAHISGGERSLLELLAGLGRRVRATVATPEGDLSCELRAHGLPVREIPGTAGSLKAHPLHTPRTAGELARAAWSVRRIADHDGADLVHANSIRAGIVAVAAARLGGVPAVVHVRDVLPDGPLTRLTRAMVAAGASAIVGNSAYTLRRFAEQSTDALLAVAHSAVDLNRLGAAAEMEQREARAGLGIPADRGPVLGVVAQLTPWKGQDDAVRIAAGLRSAHPGVRLLLAGSAKFVSSSTRHDNRAFVRRLRALIEELGLRDRVALLGERTDVPEVLRALDMLLVPSWEEPFGRAIVEALAVGVPVAATSVGGPREVLRDGVDGLLLPPRHPDAWVAALSQLLSDPGRLAAMTCEGRARATGFSRAAHADRLLSVYEDVLALPRAERRNGRKPPGPNGHTAGGFAPGPRREAPPRRMVIPARTVPSDRSRAAQRVPFPRL